MAYDKVVDSGALDTVLGGIAAAIRAKTGKTDLMTIGQMAGEIAGIETGGSGGGMPDGVNAFLLTLADSYNTSQSGWELVIPHGLGRVPAFAVVMRTSPVAYASQLRGWLGDTGWNARFTNFSNNANENVSLQDQAATWIYADDTNLYCRSGGWGGGLGTGTEMFVGVA